MNAKREMMIKDRSEEYQKGYYDGYHTGYSDKKSEVNKARKEAEAKYREILSALEISSIYPFNIIADLEEARDKHGTYSLELINKTIEQTLTERERRCLEMQYREKLTLEQIGLKVGVTRERVRQIIAKAERKLRHPRVLREMRAVSLGDYAEMQMKYEEAKTQIELLTNRIEELEGRPVTPEETNHEKDLNDKSIDHLDLSVRSYNCLKRARIDTIGDLKNLCISDLMRIRNLGRKSALEVVEKAKRYGIEIKE